MDSHASLSPVSPWTILFGTSYATSADSARACTHFSTVSRAGPWGAQRETQVILGVQEVRTALMVHMQMAPIGRMGAWALTPRLMLWATADLTGFHAGLGLEREEHGEL